MISHLGKLSTIIAILDFLALAIGIIAALSAWAYFPSPIRLPVTYLAMLICFIFPIVALVGLFIGIRGLFQPDYGKLLSILGIVLNIFNLGISAFILFFTLTFDANRFKL